MEKSIKKNYIFNMIYQIVLIIVPFIVAPYLSRILGENGTGQFSFTSSLISYFTLFATFGFDTYATREIAKLRNDPEKQNKFFWEIIICRLSTVSLSILVNVILILTGVYGKNTLLMLIMTINIVSIAFDIAFYFQGNEEFGKIVAKSLFVKLVYTACIFIFVKKASDLWIYVLLNSISVFLNASILWLTLKKKVKKPNFKELKPFKHFKFALALFIPAVASNIYAMLGKTLIGVIVDDSIADAQNGYFEQADKIFRICVTLITCLGTVMNSRNSNEISKGNHAQVQTNIYVAFNFIWILSFPITFGLIAVANNFVPWFFGDNFLSSIPILCILACALPIMGASNIFGSQYLIPYGEDKKYTIALVSGMFASIISNLILIYFFKALGASIACVISEFTVAFIMFMFLRKKLSPKEMFKTAVKPLFSAIVMFFVVKFVSGKLSSTVLHTVILIFIGIVVYFAMLLILREKLVISTLKSVKQKYLSKKKVSKNQDSGLKLEEKSENLTSNENLESEKQENSTESETKNSTESETEDKPTLQDEFMQESKLETEENPLLKNIEKTESEIIDNLENDKNSENEE